MKNLAKRRIQCEGFHKRVVKQFGMSYVKCKFDLGNAIQTKAEFSHVNAVMDRIGGWEEEDERENWVGPRFAAKKISLWSHQNGLDRHVKIVSRLSRQRRRQSDLHHQ